MPKAKYEGIYHSIKKRIEAQDYPYQSLLPSENTLIEEYACSRNTVRRALAELIADGYVQAMQGRGVRVIYQRWAKRRLPSAASRPFKRQPAATICKPLPVSFGLRRSLQPSSLLRKADFLRAMNCGRYSVCVIWTEKH